MDILRTPAERFESVPDFNWPITYIDDLPGYQGLRTAVLDTGPGKAASTFLCLHGEPTWSFLYRKMIAVFVAAGHRVVAPDLIGFGRSDKPLDDAVYTFDFHRGHLIALLERLDLNELTLVCQDWGGILGLTLPMVFPDRFDGLVVMNTMLGTGDQPLSKGFIAYDAPFPDVRFKAGVRRFPQLVPDHRDAPGAATSRLARDWWQNAWTGRTLMAVGLADPVLGEAVMANLRQSIRNCPAPMLIADAGHFTQEWGGPIAEEVIRRWT